MKRRELFEMMLKGSVGLLSMPLLTSCLSRVTSIGKDTEGTVKIQDLLVERHDNPKFPNFYILPAKNIRDNIPTTFVKKEKNHEHEIVVEPHHYARIKRGETVIVSTNVVKGHTHSFRINLARYIEDSEVIEVPFGPSPEALEGVAPLTPEQVLKLNA